MKLLISATSALAILAGQAFAQDAQTGGASAPQETQSETASTATNTEETGTTGEATSEATSDASGAAYEPDWQAGWVVTAHETDVTDMSKINPAWFARWVDDDSEFRSTDYFNFLPSSGTPLLLAGQYRTGYLNIAEAGSYRFKLFGFLPARDDFTPQLHCSVKLDIEGAPAISNSDIWLADLTGGRETRSGGGAAKKFAIDHAELESIATTLEPGLYDTGLWTNCREFRGGSSLANAKGWNSAARLMMTLGYVDGYGFGYAAAPKKVTEQYLGTVHENMGIEWALYVSKDGGDYRPVAYDEIVHDANEAPMAGAGAGYGITIAPKDALPQLADGWSQGLTIKGVQSDVFGLKANPDPRIPPTFEGAIERPTWTTFEGDRFGQTTTEAKMRSRIETTSNFVATEDGLWTFAASIKGAVSMDGAWRGCHQSIEIDGGNGWQTLAEGYRALALDGENYLIASANLTKGLYPMRVTSTCPLRTEGEDFSREIQEEYGWGRGGLIADRDGNLLGRDTEKGYVHSILIKAPSEDMLRFPNQNEFVVKGQPDLPPLRANEDVKKKSAPVKIAPKPVEVEKPAEPAMKTEGDLSADEIGAALQAADIIKLNLSVEFESGSDQLTTAGRRTVAELAKALNHPALANSRFVLDGHTDSDGNDKANFDLSMRRAKTVLTEMVMVHDVKMQTTDQERLGVPKGPEDLRFSVQAWGESQPIASNDTPEGKARNRRVTIFRAE